MSGAPHPLDGAPDLINPLIGFRQWRLAERTLNSMFSHTHWPDAHATARCRIGRHEPTYAPEKSCTCGIYAYYEPCPRTASAMTSDLLGGAVILWGRIEIHATGMRAQHARIVGLELPLSRGRKRRAVVQAAECLGIPAVSHRELTAVALAHGMPLQRSLRPPRTRSGAAPPRTFPALEAT
jgi:hypothetical protein